MAISGVGVAAELLTARRCRRRGTRPGDGGRSQGRPRSGLGHEVASEFVRCLRQSVASIANDTLVVAVSTEF